MIHPSIAIFDVGHVLFEWDPRFLFEKLIADPDERTDRAAERPDLVATLRARVVDWEAFGTRLIPDYAALLQASECASTP